MRRIVPILLLATVILVGVAMLLDPTIRYPLVGVRLERDLESLAGNDVIAVVVGVDTGTEVLAEETLNEDPVMQDTYELFMLLNETSQVQTQGSAVKYDVEQMESEQWAWKEARLDQIEARTQVFPRSLPKPPTLKVPQKSVLAEPDVWAPFLSFLWPKLPSGFLKAGDSSWTEQFSFKVASPVAGQEVELNYTLAYRLGQFVSTSHGVFATVEVLGTLSEAAGQDPSIEVQGKVKGFTLIEPSTGRASSGEYRVEQRVMVHQPGLPVVRRVTYQGLRFWRPKFHHKMSTKPDVTPGFIGEDKDDDNDS